MRAVGYIRVSTEHQAEKGDSLETQRDGIKDYCLKKGWKLVEIYKDGGLSGSTSERPAYQQMLRDLKKDKFDVVVVTKIDRLSRNIRDFVFFLDLIEKHNKSFVSVTQNFDTSTPMGRLTLNILASFAQFEREIISERIREVMFKKALRGNQWLGGPPPMGYSLKDKKLVINEEEALLVKEIFKTYIAVQSTSQTAEILTSRGFTYRGKHIASTTVGRVLTNRVYIGDFIWGKRKKGNMGMIEKPEKEWIIIPNVIPPIIEEDLFYRANAILKTNRERQNKRSTAMLSGILYCKQCGNKMYRATSRPYIPKHKEPKREIYHYYRCRGLNYKVCDAPPVEENELDNAVIQTIETLIKDKSILDNFFKSIKESPHKQKDIEKLKKRKKKIEEKTQKLLDLYLNDQIQKEIYLEKTKEFTEQIEILENEIFTLENRKFIDFDIATLNKSLREIIELKNDKQMLSKFLREIFSGIIVDTKEKEIVFLMKSSPKVFDIKTAVKIARLSDWRAFINL